TYQFRVHAVNANGLSNAYSLGLKATRAAEPSTGSVTGAGVNYLDASWQAPDNPLGTIYELHAIKAGPGGATILGPKTTQLSGRLSGLEPLAFYTVEVHAVNHGRLETAWVTLGSSSTLSSTTSVPKPVIQVAPPS